MENIGKVVINLCRKNISKVICLMLLILVSPTGAQAQTKGMCGIGPEIPQIDWGGCPDPNCYMCDSATHMCTHLDCPVPQNNPNDPCCPPSLGEKCNPDINSGGVPCVSPNSGFKVSCDGLNIPNTCKFELGLGWGCPQNQSECASGLYCETRNPVGVFPGSCMDITKKSCRANSDCDMTYPDYFCSPVTRKCTLGAHVGEACNDPLAPICDAQNGFSCQGGVCK